MILTQALRQDGKDAILVEGNPVADEHLEQTLRRLVGDSGKTELVIDAKGVAWGTVVKIIDAAGGARIRKVHFKTERPAAPS
jgi:biopolymer transport protein ExbD